MITEVPKHIYSEPDGVWLRPVLCVAMIEDHFDLSDSHPLCKLIADGHVYVTAVPVSGPAMPNKCKAENQAVLDRSGFVGVFHGRPMFEDGTVVVTESIAALRIASEPEAMVVIPSGTTLPLEVGYCTSCQTLDRLRHKGSVARIAYQAEFDGNNWLYLLFVDAAGRQKLKHADDCSSRYLKLPK